jgi:hypothetical protein
LCIIASVGVEDLKTHKIKIYPVPANDFVVIELSDIENANLILYNFVGQQIHLQVLTEKMNTIDLSMYPSGFYHITIFGSNYSYSEKIILKK